VVSSVPLLDTNVTTKVVTLAAVDWEVTFRMMNWEGAEVL
jgi:hypothetical protein